MIEGINLSIEGEGIPMLLLHGWGANKKMMQPLAEYFKKDYRVCNLDLPGFGESKEMPRSYSIYDYVLVIREIIKKYQLQDPIIIAHSFGARIAFQYAALFSVRYLIIAGGAGIPSKKSISYYGKVYFYKILKVFNIHVEMGSSDYRKASDIMKETLVKAVNEDASNAIMQIECPILLVWGDKDSETPLWMAKKIQKLNKNAVLVVFKGDDHFAYFHQMSRFIRVCEYALKGSE